MKRLPLVIAVLLVTTVIGVGVGLPSGGVDGERQAASVDAQPSSQPQLSDANPSQLSDTMGADTNVTNTVAIPAGEIERSDLRRQYADLGPAAEFDTDLTTDRLATRTIEHELDALAADERGERIAAELNAVETEIDALETRERTAIREFSREELAPRELLIELATIHLEAATLRDRTDMLESQASTLDGEPISTSRLQRMEYDLQMLEGPLRAHVVSVLRAERPADRILIETSDTSITMAAIDNEQYIREVNRKPLRGTGDSQLTPERIEELTTERYPTLWEQSTSWSTDGLESVFVMSVSFDQGELRTFTDGPTERTFIEHQRLPLDDVITGSETTKVQDGLNVTVEQTYAGGPLRLTVTDAETGEPLEATVTVGQDGQESQTVGTTNADGALWTLSPRASFTVTVLGEDTSAAFVDITPPAPETVTSGQ
ncbi:DUF7096 domain-containing protein [Halohasta litorea]|uniref:Carboxypeptidase regulatory-like domain-containing protein n=1 Tax=Halohasta litorea TaxID=869891 RepID=A0ABD6D623_9EURY|nr:hypothetical protein [Halohasta litorea]